MSKVFLPMFSVIFMVTSLTFKSLIHFEFIPVFGVRMWSSFFFSFFPQVSLQFSQHYWLKQLSLPHCIFFFKKNSFIHFRKREEERKKERNINWLSHLFMHSLVNSCMCPNWESNLKPWHIGTMFWPTELSSRSHCIVLPPFS